VREIFWINGEAPPRLAIVLCPRGDNWLDGDLQRMRQGGIKTVVSLLDPDEAEWLGLKNEKGAAERAGLNFLSHPIQDAHVPANVPTFRQFITGIADRLRAGEAVGVHCRGSIGRATVTAACSLISLGWDPAKALAAIERARGTGVPDTPEQKTWILAFKAQP
jgi:protein-tyrosine phosphatase